MRSAGIEKMGGQDTSRFDTLALKNQFERKLGHQRSQSYFNLLSRYLSRKISKSDFGKLCVTLIGRENLRLHNLLIQNILKNASCAKSSPPKEREKEAKIPYAFPQTLRKARTQVTRDSKSKNCPSPLGLNGKTASVVHEKKTISTPKVQEQQSISLEDGEEVEQASGSSSMYSKSPVRAPFGVTIKGKEHKKLLLNGSTLSSPLPSCLSSGGLPDTNSLRSQLEKKLEMEGLKISSDCAGLLNSSLDIYLKRLIKPCLQLASCRKGNEIHKQAVFGLNGLRPARNVLKRSGPVSASLLDFRVAMQSNPSRLGADWPEFLERVCSRDDCRS